MSYDLALWKWKKPQWISPGLCYLLLAEGVEIQDVEPLDQDYIYRELEAAFPESNNPDKGAYLFECRMLPTGMIFTLSSSTPISFLEWITQFAQREKLFLFDPQQDNITKKDEKNHKK